VAFEGKDKRKGSANSAFHSQLSSFLESPNRRILPEYAYELSPAAGWNQSKPSTRERRLPVKVMPSHLRVPGAGSRLVDAGAGAGTAAFCAITSPDMPRKRSKRP